MTAASKGGEKPRGKTILEIRIDSLKRFLLRLIKGTALNFEQEKDTAEG